MTTMITSLTFDLDTSASILGTEPDLFLKFVETKNIPGILFFTEKPQISIFTLAQLLNTKPEVLLDWLEDEALAELIEEVEEDEWFEGQESQLVYQTILAEEG
jgi:hypothetical protein